MSGKVVARVRNAIRGGGQHLREQIRQTRLEVCDEEVTVVASPKLEQWPAQARRARALIACGRGLYMLADLRVRKVACGHFYGLTRYGGHHYVSRRHSREKGSLYCFRLEEGRITGSKQLFSGLSGGVHQIDFIDDRLYVMDSYRNEIVIMSAKGQPLQRVYPFGKAADGRESPNYAHLNSIYAVGEQVYVIAHNDTIKTGKPSEVLVFQRDEDMASFDLIGDIGRCSHNIVVQDGLFLTCDSLGGSLKNHDTVVFQPSTFTRGLAFDDDLMLVGGSAYSERGERLSNDGYIYFLNRSFDPIGTLQISDAGQVHEIRLLGKDYGLSNHSA